MTDFAQASTTVGHVLMAFAVPLGRTGCANEVWLSSRRLCTAWLPLPRSRPFQRSHVKPMSQPARRQDLIYLEIAVAGLCRFWAVAVACGFE